jgi:chemotaxis protein CheX
VTTAASSVITEILNGTIQSVSTVIPIPMTRERPSMVKGPILQSEIGVLLGIAGSVPGQLLVHGTRQVFSGIASAMFGMALNDDMLESFIGELGNMLGGNMCTNVSSAGILIEITPPTVLVGETKLTGFSQQALLIPLIFDEVGKLEIILILNETSK